MRVGARLLIALLLVTLFAATPARAVDNILTHWWGVLTSCSGGVYVGITFDPSAGNLQLRFSGGSCTDFRGEVFPIQSSYATWFPGKKQLHEEIRFPAGSKMFTDLGNGIKAITDYECDGNPLWNQGAHCSDPDYGITPTYGVKIPLTRVFMEPASWPTALERYAVPTIVNPEKGKTYKKGVLFVANLMRLRSFTEYLDPAWYEEGEVQMVVEIEPLAGASKRTETVKVIQSTATRALPLAGGSWRLRARTVWPGKIQGTIWSDWVPFEMESPPVASPRPAISIAPLPKDPAVRYRKQ